MTTAPGRSWTGPETSVTCPCRAAAAMAWPCLPTTGWRSAPSIVSVGPETITCSPARPCCRPQDRSTAAMISSGSAMRPSRLVRLRHLAAVRRRNGCRPSEDPRLRRVADGPHGGPRGAASTGLSVASRTAVARSSAWLPAILAKRSAVAGAMTIMSASRARRYGRRRPPAVEEPDEDSSPASAHRQRRHNPVRLSSSRRTAACVRGGADEVERFTGDVPPAR
jgi:hypothetical protein